MDYFKIRNKDILKILNNISSSLFEYIHFSIHNDGMVITGIDYSKTISYELVLNKDLFLNYEIANKHDIPFVSSQFKTIIKSCFSKFLKNPNVIISIDKDKNFKFIIEEIESKISITKYLNSVKLLKYDHLGLPNLPIFEKSPFCNLNQPEMLKIIHNNFVDSDIIEIKIIVYFLIFKNIDSMEDGNEIKIKCATKGSANSSLFKDNIKQVSEICDLKCIKNSKISIHESGSIKIQHFFEDGTLAYFVAPSII